MRTSRIVLLVIVLLLAAGAGIYTLWPARLHCPECNVLIIGIDTLRADRLHAFGYSRETTPTLDALAANGVSFTNAISASSWTVPSFMSIMTGVYPSVHEVTNKFSVFTATEQKFSGLSELAPDITTLAEVLKRSGYATGGFAAAPDVSAKFGYGKGFDEFVQSGLFGKMASSSGPAFAWLDSLPKRQKFFMFFHGYDAHGYTELSQDERVFVPSGYDGLYTGSRREATALRQEQLTQPLTLTPEDVAFWNGLYDSKIRKADAEVAALLDELRKRGVLDNTLVIVLSDHGEEFYEHGGTDHGLTLYDELIRVPLIINIPRGTRGLKIPAQVSTMDVAPTIFDILDITPGETFSRQQQGKSLLPYFAGTADAGRDVFVETDYRDFTHKRGIRTADGWKLIVTMETGTEELYNLTNDPKEATDLARKLPQKTAELRGKLDAHLRDDLSADLSKTYTTGCLPVYKGECE